MANPETGQPDNCVYPQPGAPTATPTGGYSPTLNPFVYFHSLLDLGDCSANDVPLTELEKDLKKVDSTPNYSYISPNLCNAGVTGQCAPGAPEGAAAADAFLAQLVPKILASARLQEGRPADRHLRPGQPAPPIDPATGAPRGDHGQPAQSRHPAALQIRHPRLDRRRRLRPLLAAQVDRGPLRPRPRWKARNRQGQVLRPGAPGRKRRRLAGWRRPARFSGRLSA